jgi:uncharacterized protein YuzE
MKIVISRHARRRLQLYSISEADVIQALRDRGATAKTTGTRGVILDETCADKYRFPLEIVFEIAQTEVIVITAYPLKKGGEMKVYYDAAADAVYLELSKEQPDGVVEVSEGVNLDTTRDNHVVGIEILNASAKIPLASLLSYEVDPELVKIPVGT